MRVRCGNVTGTGGLGGDLGGKLVDLIREVLPSTHRVGVLANTEAPYTKLFLASLLNAQWCQHCDSGHHAASGRGVQCSLREHAEKPGRCSHYPAKPPAQRHCRAGVKASASLIL